MATLLNMLTMPEYKDGKMLVFLAGYHNEMDRMLQSNLGTAGAGPVSNLQPLPEPSDATPSGLRERQRGRDVLRDRVKRGQSVAGQEYVVGPAGGLDDHFLGLDRAVDGEFVRGGGRADTDVSGSAKNRHQTLWGTIAIEFNSEAGG